MLLENIPIGLGLRGIRSCTSHPSGVHIKRVDQSCPSPRKSTKMNIIAERTGSVLYVTRCAQIHPARGDFHHVFASKDIVAIPHTLSLSTSYLLALFMSSYLLPRMLEVLLSSDETDTLCGRLHRFEGKSRRSFWPKGKENANGERLLRMARKDYIAKCRVNPVWCPVPLSKPAFSENIKDGLANNLNGLIEHCRLY